MRTTLKTGLMVAAGLAMPCSGQWWWPPTDGLSTAPECISASTVAALTVSGQWPDSCIPNFISSAVSGNEVDLFTVRDPPPTFCLTVIRPWSLTANVGPLPAGTYTVYATHRVAGQTVHPRVQVGTLTVVAICDPLCYANCDQSTGNPMLTANDFSCFLNSYVAGESYANCDASTGAPTLTANDFACFLNLYVNGCS